MSYKELLIGCGHMRDKRIYPPGSETLEGWHDLTTLDHNPDCKPDILFDLTQLHWQSLISRQLKIFAPYPIGIVDEHERELALIEMDRYNKEVIAYNDECIMPASSFNEIHAYEVLEHIGAQGDANLFFKQFKEFWRVLKPNGYFCATVPTHDSLWAWGDPSHTRIINAGTLVFLSKKEYEKQLGKTSMTDFRSFMGDMDFNIVRARTIGVTFEFILQAVK